MLLTFAYANDAERKKVLTEKCNLQSFVIVKQLFTAVIWQNLCDLIICVLGFDGKLLLAR